MAHDFAHRTSRPQRSHAQSAAGTRFHLTSFASGALVGAVLAIAAFLAPHWWPIDALEATASASTNRSENTAPNAASGPKYEFYTELERSRVRTDPTPYDGPAAAPADTPSPATPVGAATDAKQQFVLQAGSFRTHDDAERLRQSLETAGFNTITTTVRIGDGSQVHRVLVGPFAAAPDAHRAIAALKERNIDPMLLRR